jgi:hypothetical protein
MGFFDVGTNPINIINTYIILFSSEDEDKCCRPLSGSVLDVTDDV